MKNRKNSSKGFSLVEMLMALLVASLLMAALAPVMTRRISDREIKIMSETANYDKDTIISVFTTDTDFNIPQDANQVRVTLMGGGGKGGDANHGSMVITNSQSITLPEGVTKVRALLIGGGGGGGAGGYGTGTIVKSIPATEEKFESYTSGGQFTFNKLNLAQKLPAMDSTCADSGVDKWTLNQNSSLAFAPNSTILRITACGAGGGGGGGAGGGGGSGGYFDKRMLVLPSNINSIQVNIGGYGGGGGADNVDGNNGGSWQGGAGGGGGSNIAISPTQPNGGGSGGKTINDHGGTGGRAGAGCIGNGMDGIFASEVHNLDKIIEGGISECGAGNGGSAPAQSLISEHYGPAGGGGAGCYTAGGGGGGGGNSSGGGGGGATFITNYTNFNNVSLIAPGGGGGGGGGPAAPRNQGGGGGGGGGIGGGKGGNGGGYSSITMTGIGRTNGYPGIGGKPDGIDGEMKNGGAITTIFGNNNCNGGNGGNTGESNGFNGKPGAMRVYYGGASLENFIKCNYSGGQTTGGGGGGGGQITVTEINVPNSRTLYMKVGAGGKGGKKLGEAGIDGEDTAIYANNENGSRLAIATGGSAGHHENGAAGNGSGINIIKNWTEKTLKGGKKGSTGYSTTYGGSTAGFGGTGGSSEYYNPVTKEIIEIHGGNNGGNAEKNGGSPKENNQNITTGIFYGAGGGGGAGTTGEADNAGTGGDGGAGYIYIEWGGTNGGGGTSGELVQKIYTNIDASNRVMKIRIGRGGSTSNSDENIIESTTQGISGNGGITSVKAFSGGKEITYKAQGGIKGKDGNLDTGNHGKETEFPDNYSDTYKEYVQGNLNIITGQKGKAESGGTGGYLACIYKIKDNDGNTICLTTAVSNDGSDSTAGPVRPGCGGTSIPSPLYEAICNPFSSNDSANGGNGQFGGGGGGGAVLNNIKGNGGDGGNGFVILEYKSTKLD